MAFCITTSIPATCIALIVCGAVSEKAGALLFFGYVYPVRALEYRIRGNVHFTKPGLYPRLLSVCADRLAFYFSADVQADGGDQ